MKLDKNFLLGLVVSLIAGCLAVIIFKTPPFLILVGFWGLGGLPGSSILLTIIFLVINFIALTIFKQKENIKRGIKWGFLVIIPFVIFFALPNDYMIINVLSTHLRSYMASSSGDVNACMKIPDLFGSDAERNDCLYQISLLKKPGDATICDKMTEKTVPGQATKVYCYDNYYEYKATETGDVSWCSKSHSQLSRNVCYQLAAIKTNNYSFCGYLLPDDAIQNCYTVFLTEHKTPQLINEICPLISNQKYCELAGCDACGSTIYTNKQFGFSFEHPDNTTIETSNENLSLPYKPPFNKIPIAYFKLSDQSETEGYMMVSISNDENDIKNCTPNLNVISDNIGGTDFFSYLTGEGGVSGYKWDYKAIKNNTCFDIEVSVFPGACVNSGCEDKLWSKQTELDMLNKFIKFVQTFKFIEPQISSATDRISGWKTYTNSKYSFQFKYPEGQYWLDTSLFDQGYNTLGIRNYYGHVNGENIVSSISIYLHTPNQCVDIGCDNLTSQENINGYIFTKNSGNKELHNSGAMSETKCYRVVHNNYCYDIISQIIWNNSNQEEWKNEQENISSEVISTFKFTK